MKVTKPEMSTADLYLSFTAVERNHKNTVVAIMLAKEKESTLYTACNAMPEAPVSEPTHHRMTHNSLQITCVLSFTRISAAVHKSTSLVQFITKLLQHHKIMHKRLSCSARCHISPSQVEARPQTWGQIGRHPSPAPSTR